MNDWAEFRHFRYLLTILEKQGFRLAAQELNASQPNLTVQARQFQENASIRLFRKARSGRIRPTETGIAFIALARFLLTTRDEVFEALRSIEQGEIRSARFGCSPWVDTDLFRTFCSFHTEILPGCPIFPTHDDTAHLAEDVLAGIVDAAVITLPLTHPDLQVEEVRCDRLVVCLRKDNPYTRKMSLRIADLQGNLSVLFHPRRHPGAHERLVEMLEEAGLHIENCSHASNPYELQMLVKEGRGFALIREGSVLDPQLTTRPITGVDWTVDTAVIYRKQDYAKTIPVVVKELKRHCSETAKSTVMNPAKGNVIEVLKRPSQSEVSNANPTAPRLNHPPLRGGSKR